MSRFINPKYAPLEAYTPGEQPRDMQYIKLNTNESPFPAPEKVVEAVSSSVVKNLRLYCDPTCLKLKQKLAEYYGVGVENVFVSNGSDDILNFAFMAFSGGYVGARFPDISYGFYKVFAQLHGITARQMPLRDDFTIDIADYTACGDFVVIPNPNAPTGIALSLEAVEKLAASNPNTVVLIDEAYVDFGAQSSVELTKKYDNLLTVMTYSKSRSLAGARLGFAIGSAELIADLEKIKYSTNPYSVNSMTLAAGEAALDCRDYYEANCRTIEANREYASEELKKLGFNVLPSKANFIFTESPDIDGGELYLKLKAKGVLVRHFTTPRISNFNRITIGTKEEMDALLCAVKEILEEAKA